jgi:long-chain fatty acid transport protein
MARTTEIRRAAVSAHLASALALLVLVGGTATSVRAAGLYLNEFATPSMGTAGAGAEAYSIDASTAFAMHNPAGMTRLEGHQVSLGAGLIAAETEFDADSDTPFSGGNGGDQAGLAPLVGSHWVASATDDLKLGMSVFTVSGAALDPKNAWTGRSQLQEIELLTLSANPSVAYRITDQLSLSAGFIAMYADVDYKLAAPPGGGGKVEVDGDDWAYGWNLGALLEISPETRIGAIYVSQVQPDFGGDLQIKTRGGRDFSTASDLKFTFPQLIRVGGYHELDDQWAILGTVGWEQWSAFDELFVSVEKGSTGIPTEWKDTYHFSGGVHYRPAQDWLLQAGITYDTSPVTDKHRTAYLPMDRQIRYAVGVQHQLSDRMSVGGSLEYVDLGDAKIDNSTTLKGEYQDNHIIAFALNLSYKF